MIRRAAYTASNHTVTQPDSQYKFVDILSKLKIRADWHKSEIACLNFYVIACKYGQRLQRVYLYLVLHFDPFFVSQAS